MQPPGNNPPKPKTPGSPVDWKVRHGTSISLGGLPNMPARPLNTRPLNAPKPGAPKPAQPKPAAGAPQLSRAFMAGSLVPPRSPGAARPQPAPQTAKAEGPRPMPAPQPASRPAAPQPVPTPQPMVRAVPGGAPQLPLHPAAQAARAEPAMTQPAAAAPEPAPAPTLVAATPAAAPAVEAPAEAAPRRKIRTARDFNAAIARDIRDAGKPAGVQGPSLFNRRNLMMAGAAVVVIGGGLAAALWIQSRGPAPLPGDAATPVTIAAPVNPQGADTTVASTASTPAAAPPTFRNAGVATNPPGGQLRAPRPAAVAASGARPPLIIPATPEVPDLSRASAAPAEPGPVEVAPAPPPPAPPQPGPVIRLPSADEPFSTNPENPGGG